MKGNDAIELALHWHNYRAKTATVSAKNRERSHTLKLFLEKKSALFTHLAGPQDKLRRLKTSLIKTSKDFSKFFELLAHTLWAIYLVFMLSATGSSFIFFYFLDPVKRNQKARCSYSFWAREKIAFHIVRKLNETSLFTGQLIAKAVHWVENDLGQISQQIYARHLVNHIWHTKWFLENC